MDSDDNNEHLINRLKFNDNVTYKSQQCQAQHKSDKNNMHTRADQIPSNSNILNGPLVTRQQLHPFSVNQNDCEAKNIMTPNSSSRLQSEEINSSLTCNTENQPYDQETPSSKGIPKPDMSDREEVERMNIEKSSCQRYKPCHEKTSTNNYDFNVPTTSSMNVAPENLKEDRGSFKDNTKRPSSLRLNRSNVGAEDSSSDTGNDDYSLGSEDGCIYTYRGGEHLADLPSSFFSLDMGLPLDKHLPVPPHYPLRQEGGPVNNQGRVSRASSPDMDFLEMDFDPGPSCEADTGGKSSPEGGSDVSGPMPDEAPPPIREDSPIPEQSLQVEQMPMETESNTETHQNKDNDINNTPSTGIDVQPGPSEVHQETTKVYGQFITHVNFRGEQLLVRRTTSSCSPNPTLNLHTSGGDVVSLNEKEESEAIWALNQNDQKEKPAFNNANLASVLYHQTMAKKLIVEKSKEDFIDGADSSNLSWEAESSSEAEDSGVVEVPRSMVWSEQEACEQQVVQNGASTCGVVAVINAFLALGIHVDPEKIKSAIGIRQRNNDAPLARYLLSRAVAGCTAAELVTGIQQASDGLATARFFPLYPERAISLSHWLADWISVGAVPIATLNLQAGCEGDIPDAWHHQMIFGVSPRGVYLCNPVECTPEAILWPRLASSSTLLVRTRDVLSRFTPCADLTPLMHVPDDRFHTYNVVGQVVNVLREWRAAGWSEEWTRTRHVRIPAAYQAGITVAALVGTEAHWRLTHTPQPPPLVPQARHSWSGT